MSERKYRFVWDKKQQRPVCVLLQAVYGGDRGACAFFREWSIDGNPKDFIGVTATASELREIAAKLETRP